MSKAPGTSRPMVSICSRLTPAAWSAATNIWSPSAGVIAALAQIRAENEVLRAHTLDACRGVREGDARRVPHPLERSVRSHEDAECAELHFRAQRGCLLHLRLAHVDHVELRVG